MTVEELAKIMPYAKRLRVERFIDPLNATMAEFQIDLTIERETMFISQIAHESGSLMYTTEIDTGDRYQGRADLGNTELGDGRRFKGRGLIQLTGRRNHEAYADYKGLTLEGVLAYLQTDEGATNVAGWFWETNGLNELADAGDFRAVSAVINTGRRTAPAAHINGWAERLAYWERAKAVLA